MSTLNQLFPGQTGRLQLMRVMLLLRRPDLKSLDRDEPLSDELEKQLREALGRVRKA
ncbi:MAG: hypothetical protein KC621_26130 [Myxococcales bacterium]|nr:hypothetical protein [Myxococcales bacterium]